MLSEVFTPSSNASEKRERERNKGAAEVRCDSEVMCDECDVKTTGQPTGAEGQMFHTRTDRNKSLLLRHGRFYS